MPEESVMWGIVRAVRAARSLVDSGMLTSGNSKLAES